MFCLHPTGSRFSACFHRVEVRQAAEAYWPNLPSPKPPVESGSLCSQSFIWPTIKTISPLNHFYYVKMSFSSATRGGTPYSSSFSHTHPARGPRVQLYFQVPLTRCPRFYLVPPLPWTQTVPCRSSECHSDGPSAHTKDTVELQYKSYVNHTVHLPSTHQHHWPSASCRPAHKLCKNKRQEFLWWGLEDTNENC